MRQLRLTLALVIAFGFLATAVLAAPRPGLRGPRTVKVGKHVAVVATGLKRGRYRLFLERIIKPKSATIPVFCLAGIGKAKVVSGRATFAGTIPSSLACFIEGTQDGGTNVTPGKYRFVVGSLLPPDGFSTKRSELMRSVRVRG
jgi:hypothetical protein